VKELVYCWATRTLPTRLAQLARPARLTILTILTILTLLVSSAILGADTGLCSWNSPQPRSAASSRGLAARPTVPVYTYRIVHVYPHDPSAFTQGLVFDNGFLYEGTGNYGSSTLRKVELRTGKILRSHRLLPQYFGEGITLYQNKIVQLTWQSHVGFVYEKTSFKLQREFHYPMEGWGVTYDGSRLIVSDGTSILRFLNPETFEEIGRLQVSDNNGPVSWLNELEFVRGEIYANVWQTDRIAKISPQTGQVVGWIELRGLLARRDLTRPVDVLNGIAYDSKRGRLFVTGKWWPKLFEIRITKK
jgi:glutaminyl-peptide cyclotransferase